MPTDTWEQLMKETQKIQHNEHSPTVKLENLLLQAQFWHKNDEEYDNSFQRCQALILLFPLLENTQFKDSMIHSYWIMTQQLFIFLRVIPVFIPLTNNTATTWHMAFQQNESKEKKNKTKERWKLSNLTNDCIFYESSW